MSPTMKAEATYCEGNLARRVMINFVGKIVFRNLFRVLVRRRVDLWFWIRVLSLCCARCGALINNNIQFWTWAFISGPEYSVLALSIQFWPWAFSSGLEHSILILRIQFWACTQPHFCSILRASNSFLVQFWRERNSIPLHRINVHVNIFYDVN